MPNPNEPRTWKKVTIRLLPGQIESIERMYPKLTYNEAIRAILQSHIESHHRTTEGILDAAEEALSAGQSQSAPSAPDI